MPRVRPSIAVPVVAAALVVATVLAVIRWTAPPATPPVYDGDRPEPAASGYVEHTASVAIAVPPDRFRAWVDAPGRELGDIVETADGLSPVVATQPLRGDWDPSGDRTGDRRRVQFADGHHLAEEVLVDTPERFRYVIWGFTSYQRLAVRHAVAEFTYAEHDGGTVLTWSYRFLPTTPVVRPFVRSFVDDTIVAMMAGTLEGMRAGAERDVTGAG